MIENRSTLRYKVGWSLVAAVALATAGVGPEVAEAQAPDDTPYDMREDSSIGLGYLANLPNVSTGLTFFHMLGGGWGYFVDVKHTLDSQEDDPHFMGGMSPDTAEFMGHRNFNDVREYTAASGGVMWAFHPEVAVYAGAGWSERRAFSGYQQYPPPADEEDRIGDEGGHYWVRDDAESRTGLNATGGLVFQAGTNLFIRAGAELFPAGANAALILTLPR